MKWVKFKIKTLTEAEDIIISTLYDIGLEGAQIEDKVPLTAAEKEQMFVDILPETEEDDGVAYLSFFVEEKDGGMLEVNGESVTAEEIPYYYRIRHMLDFQPHVHIHLIFLIERQYHPQYCRYGKKHPECQDVLATLSTGGTA